jgi:integrase
MIDRSAAASAELATTTTAELVPAELVASAKHYAEATRAAATRRAYATSWRAFDAWCGLHRLPSLPAAPETVALYLVRLADQGRKVATIERALVAISQAHKLAGYPSPRSDPALCEILKGIRRRLGVAQEQKAPMLVEALRHVIGRLPGGLRGIRDRAVLTVGFAGAFRRSELVALDVEDLEWTGDGWLKILVRRSKTDQEGVGMTKALPCGSDPETCPHRTLRAWLEASGITSGAIFRDARGRRLRGRLKDQAVARIVKRAAKAAGLEPESFAGHSLRAGLATSAARAGKTERAIMRQTGHRSERQVRKYIRDAEMLGQDNAAAGIGL